MAEKNDWFSQCNNLKTSAEITYRYITKHIDFDESHTGLEDVKIEVEIFAHCLKQHKKLDWNIKRNCWMIPNRTYKEWRA